MLKSILLPLDRSARSERGLPFAIRIARASAAELTLVHAAAVPCPDARANSGEGERELRQIATELRSQGLKVRTCVRAGPAAQIILEEARSRAADLIVMNTHGPSGIGRVRYGRVVDEVLRLTTRPLLLVPPSAEQPWPTDQPLRIPVALNGAAEAEAVVGPASDLARIFGARWSLLRVIPPLEAGASAHDGARQLVQAERYLRLIADRLRTPTQLVDTLVMTGHPGRRVASVAQEVGAHLIALPTHGRRGAAEPALGPVATGALQQTTVPLLVVRPSGVSPTPPPRGMLSVSGRSSSGRSPATSRNGRGRSQRRLRLRPRYLIARARRSRC